MNKKIIIGIIAIIVIIGVLSFVSSSNLLSDMESKNPVIIAPTPPTPHHYSLKLNDTAGAAAHP